MTVRRKAIPRREYRSPPKSKKQKNEEKSEENHPKCRKRKEIGWKIRNRRTKKKK